MAPLLTFRPSHIRLVEHAASKDFASLKVSRDLRCSLVQPSNSRPHRNPFLPASLPLRSGCSTVWKRNVRIRVTTCLPSSCRYDHVLKTSHAFNILDARGAVGVTERQRFFGKMRK